MGIVRDTGPLCVSTTPELAAVSAEIFVWQEKIREDGSEYVRSEYHNSNAVKKPRRGCPAARVNRKLCHHEREKG